MGDETPHIRIHKWDELQHYKDREPPWIKLYNRLLDHYEFGRLPDAAKGHYVGLLMLRSRRGEPLPLDVDWLASRINATTPLDLEPLVNAGLIEVYHSDSRPLAQDASTPQAFARSREAETEAETEESTEGSSLRSSPSGAEPRVENSPEDEGESWNDRLAPVVREVAYLGTGPPEGWKISRCMSRLKQLKDQGYSTRELEDGLRGLRWMVEREHEAICDKEGTPFIRQGQKFRAVVFNRAEERGMPLLSTAAHQWRKHGEPSANGRSGDLSRATA